MSKLETPSRSKTTDADEFLRAEQLKRLKRQTPSASSSRPSQPSGPMMMSKSETLSRSIAQYKPSELMRCGFYIAIGFWFASVVPFILYVGIEALRAAFVTATSAR